MILRKERYQVGDVVMLARPAKADSEVMNWTDEAGIMPNDISVVERVSNRSVNGISHQRIMVEGFTLSHPSSKFDYIGKL